MGLWNSYKKLWTKPLAKLQEYDLGLNQHLAE